MRRESDPTQSNAPVVDDDRVGRLEIKSQPTGARRDEEGEDRRVRSVERLNQPRALLCLGSPIQAQAVVASRLHEDFEHVERHGKLGEDEDAAAQCLCVCGRRMCVRVCVSCVWL
jgi:hypothetical protein